MVKKLSGLNLKETILQKGERFGFYAAAGLLLFFLGFGVYVAATSASSSGITGEINKNIASAKGKLDSNGGGDPPDIDDEVFKDPKKLDIKFTEYLTPNSFFNPTENSNPRRVSPKVLPAIEAVVETIQSATGAFEIIQGPDDKRLIGVVISKQASTQDPRNIKDLQRRRGIGQNKQGTPPRPPQSPQVPPGGTPPPGVPGGGPGGARGGPGGEAGPRGMGPGIGTTRTSELEVNYVPEDSKDLDRARPAETLLPLRMVVVTGTVPYRAQVQEYVRALRAVSEDYLGNDLPVYRGLVVERQILSEDGKEVLQDWQPLDVKDAYGEVFNKTMEFEPEELSQKQLTEDQELRELAPYYFRVVPDPNVHRLVLPRPKLKNAEYAPMNLPSVRNALKELKKLGGETQQLKSAQRQKLTGEVDPFGYTGGMRGPGGAPFGGDDPTAGPGGARGGFTPPPGVPTGGVPPKGGRVGGPGGEIPAGPGGVFQPGVQTAVAEDAWIFRFIDVTTEAGRAYKYRVSFEVANPNYQYDPKLLGTPDLAKKEKLVSVPFEIKDLVRVPKDEFVYAASSNPPKVTEKVPVNAAPASDETWVQVHKWFKEVQPKNTGRPEPIGDWIITDLRAVRGQYLGETTKVELPIWSMTQSMFLFRDVPMQPRPGMPRPRPRDARSWEIEIAPTPQQIVVDFEGGTGDHLAISKINKKILDSCSMDILLMTEDGRVRMIRSKDDLVNEDRKSRQDKWTNWLQAVELATQQLKAGGVNPFGGGNPRGPGGVDG